MAMPDPVRSGQDCKQMAGEVVMQYKATAYLAAIFLSGIGAALASMVYPDNGNVIIVAGAVLLAVLTFPLGFLASAAGTYCIFSGVVTPIEALVFATPIHAMLGYVQWCRVVPALYRSGS